MLGAAAMCEFASLERCAAYVAARDALIAVQCDARDWPADLRDRGRRAAADTVQLVAAAVGHGADTPARRACLRAAITAALGVAAAVDAVDALGRDDVGELQRLAGRTVALLGMLLHAGSALPGDASNGRKQTRSREPTPSPARTGSRDLTTPQMQRSPGPPPDPDPLVPHQPRPRCS